MAFQKFIPQAQVVEPAFVAQDVVEIDLDNDPNAKCKGIINSSGVTPVKIMLKDKTIWEIKIPEALHAKLSRGVTGSYELFFNRKEGSKTLWFLRNKVSQSAQQETRSDLPFEV